MSGITNEMHIYIVIIFIRTYFTITTHDNKTVNIFQALCMYIMALVQISNHNLAMLINHPAISTAGMLIILIPRDMIHRYKKSQIQELPLVHVCVRTKHRRELVVFSNGFSSQNCTKPRLLFGMNNDMQY